MKIEASLRKYIEDNLGLDTVWGKHKVGETFDTPKVSLFKAPSLSSKITPSYLDNIQVTVRGNRIDTVTDIGGSILTLLQGFRGLMEGFRVWIQEIEINGTLYEEEDLVSFTLTVPIKYTWIESLT